MKFKDPSAEVLSEPNYNHKNEEEEQQFLLLEDSEEEEENDMNGNDKEDKNENENENQSEVITEDEVKMNGNERMNGKVNGESLNGGINGGSNESMNGGSSSGSNDSMNGGTNGRRRYDYVMTESCELKWRDTSLAGDGAEPFLAEERSEKAEDRKNRDKNRSSIGVFKSEVSLWLKTHPLGPIFPLFVKLFSLLLFSGPLWVFRAIRLMVFVTFLAPAWYYGLKYYLGSPDVIRNIKYGPNARNYLDVCLPPNESKKKRPVLVFVTGGIWIIGYKAWGMFVAKVLSSYGIITILPDYRNFPQGTIFDMVDDVDASLTWTFKNIEQYGGDRDQLYLMGQSAGAHLALLTLLRKALRDGEELNRTKEKLTEQRKKGNTWQATDIRANIGIAGPYNVCDMAGHFEKRGLSKALLYRLVGDEPNLKYVSADYFVKLKEFQNENAAKYVPPIIFLHGTADLCVPYQASRKTAEALTGAGIQCYLKYYEDKSHTDSIIEDLVYAEDFCQEDMMTDIVTIISQKEDITQIEEEKVKRQGGRRRPSFLLPTEGETEHALTARSSMIPHWCYVGARFVNPF